MSRLDITMEFSDGQSIASLDDSSVVSTDVVDLAAADYDVGGGTPLYLNVKIGTACAGGTSVQFDLYGHTTTTVQSGSVIYSSGAVALADLTAGAEPVRVALPIDCDDHGRYIGMYYTAVGTMSAGTVDAWLSYNAPPNGSDNSLQLTTSNI